MTNNRTNIKIDSAVHERHNERRQELGLSWTEYLRRCEYEGDSSPVVPVEAIRAELDTDAPTFDDIKAACEAAIREEVPER